VKEELPPRPSNQFVGAVASTTATTEVEEHLRGGNADTEDHLNVVNEKMEQLKVQEEEEERLLLLFDHEMHQVRFLLSDFPFAFDANMDCQGPHLISMSICHHFQNCSEQISIISWAVEMSFAKQNEWAGHDYGMCGGVGHKNLQDDTQEDSEGLKEDELLEEELMVLSSVNPRVVSSLQAATGEMNHLHDKVAALEVQLRDERQQHQEVMAKLENLQHQLHL
jgi:hypothetical protein